MEQAFSIEEAIKFGWAKTKQHSVLVFQVVLTLFALNIAQAIVQKVLEHSPSGAGAYLVLSIVSFIVSVGAARIMLHLARGEHASYSDLIPPWNLAWKYFLLGLLLGLIVIGGLILLIIPGFYFAIRYSMSGYALIDGVGVTDSLRMSTKLTQDVKWHLVGFILIIVLLNIVGALLLGVGLLVSTPVTMIAFAHVYLKLKARHHAHVPTAN